MKWQTFGGTGAVTLAAAASGDAIRFQMQLLGSRISFERREIDFPDIQLEQLAVLIDVYDHAYGRAVFIGKFRLGDLLTKAPLLVTGDSKPQAAHAAIVHVFDKTRG